MEGDLAAAVIPLFPLHTVLFPGAALPLHIFEERYRQLVRERRDFGVVLIREGREVGSVPQVHDVGTLAAIEEVEELPDGRYNIMTRGQHRFRLRSTAEPAPYLRGELEDLPDPPPDASPRLLALLDEYLQLHGLTVAPQLSTALAVPIASDAAPRRAVWLAGAVLQAEPAKRQALLESGDPALAEALLEAEIERIQRLGHLQAVPPAGFSPN
ncbi:MAG TPA: LON peptidase substrate-binding domain-containing protein [Candidatus Dormibacteraeota bacterium]